MKTCSRCMEEKHNDAFYKNSSRVDGLSYWCKSCHKIQIDKAKAPGYVSTYNRRALHTKPRNVSAVRMDTDRRGPREQKYEEYYVAPLKETVDKKWSKMLGKLKEKGKVRT